MQQQPPVSAEKSSSETTTIAWDDLAALHRLLRQMFNRTPSRELRRAIQLLERHLPEGRRIYDSAHNQRHRS